MKTLENNKKLFIAVGLLLVLVVFFVVLSKNKISKESNLGVIEPNTEQNAVIPELNTISSNLPEGSIVIKKPETKFSALEEQKYNQFMSDGLRYKSLGDQGDKTAYFKSIEAFQGAFDLSNKTVWVPMLNIGNIYKLMGDYKNADISYDIALKIVPESTIYLAKIEMYRYNMKKSNSDISTVYEEALKSVVENASIILSYANFLKDTGNYVKSLDYFRVLSKQYPENSNFKQEITSLESKI